MGYLSNAALQLGIPVWFLIIIFAWTVFWKLFAMWKAARSNHIVWFVIIAVINTVGILPILYIYVFSKLGKEFNKNKQPRKIKKKSKKR